MLNKYTYSLSQVEEIIDLHIENDSDFLFVADFALAHYICDYISNDYGIEPESLDLSTDVEQYYISLQFYSDGDITFICETAKWDQEGQYKYDECDEQDYYIFTDMSFGDAREFLNSRGEMQFCELVGDEIVVEEEEIESMQEADNGNMMYDDDCVPCQCPTCKSARGELTEDEELEVGLVEHYAQYVEAIQCTCGCELRNILYSLVQECMSIGYENAKEEMREFLED